MSKTLAQTALVIDFPLMCVESVTLNPILGRGIMSDYIVNYHPQNLVEKRDRDLEKLCC